MRNIINDIIWVKTYSSFLGLSKISCGFSEFCGVRHRFVEHSEQRIGAARKFHIFWNIFSSFGRFSCSETSRKFRASRESCIIPLIPPFGGRKSQFPLPPVQCLYLYGWHNSETQYRRFLHSFSTSRSNCTTVLRVPLFVLPTFPLIVDIVWSSVSLELLCLLFNFVKKMLQICSGGIPLVINRKIKIVTTNRCPGLSKTILNIGRY